MLSRMARHLSGDAEADALITSDTLALLVGMVLDQPVSEGWSGAGLSAPVRLSSVAHCSAANGAEIGASDHVGVGRVRICTSGVVTSGVVATYSPPSSETGGAFF